MAEVRAAIEAGVAGAEPKQAIVDRVERAAVEPAAEWVANKAEAKIPETRAAARAVPIAEQL